eukprot:tig00000128_g7218.t1
MRLANVTEKDLERAQEAQDSRVIHELLLIRIQCQIEEARCTAYEAEATEGDSAVWPDLARMLDLAKNTLQVTEQLLAVAKQLVERMRQRAARYLAQAREAAAAEPEVAHVQ